MTQSTPAGHDLSPEATLDRRLHDAGWGLLLALTGLMWLIPSSRVPEGAWLIGVATILLSINAVRAARHIQVSGFSLVLGLLALAAGIGRSLGVNLPLLAICLLVIGASLVVKPWLGAPQH